MGNGNQNAIKKRLINTFRVEGDYCVELNSVLDPEDKQKIENAKNLAQIFMTLHEYISFFNYEIVQYLIELLGSPDDQTQLREYCSALDQFCQRNVFDVPAEAWPMLSKFFGGHNVIIILPHV